MNLYKEKNKAHCKIIIGFLGGLICLILLAMSYLKMIYFLPNIDILSRPIKNLIHFIYSKTLFLDPLWRLSPIPNMNDLFSKESISATAIAIAFVLFMMLRSSGVLRLKKLKDIEKNIKMPKQSFLSSFHSLYIAPLVIGIVLILLQKFLKI